MKIIFFSILFIFATGSTINGQANQGQNLNYGNGLLLTKPQNSNENADGSPYWDSNFRICQIEGIPSTVQLRYNAYADEMEFLNNGTTYYVQKTPNQTFYFPETKTTFVIKNYGENNDLESGYFILILKGKDYSLLKKIKINYTEGFKAQNSYQESKSASYEKQKPVYFLEHSELLYKLPQKEKEITDPKIITIIKKNGLKIKEEKDLIKLTELLNK
ncbi:hypothetical protein [Daejeonia sp. YH14]|uniref:hypothetical protein n=1 Tax=Daejeonia sp. YH14 TaxID=3439042 RepID=UPI003F49328A